MTNYRKEIIDLLIPYFEEDERFHLLLGDMGFGAVEKLQASFPKRITNCGVAEQNMVGVAAGMALSGMIPIVYSICNFLVYRALEQIRNDIVLQGLNVKLIGTGAEDYFEFLGASHCCGRQDITIMKLVGVDIFNPYELREGVDPTFTFENLVDSWITNERAGYLRV